ncbi:hypothetical protein COE80_19525 [Bacillus pseudomycoides]|uniref:phage major capsid protein n=1 Tax=Bacillus pseudomycoides TaxID=64104 RepID=UPI000BFD0041|nr:hypothetical protein [Bacillus pseudomycoides]PHB23105.1 hypothetical protein COE80_19525 [Bacillus pseudomycoides]PHE37634.1 hypothetical protein COF51_16490 [Bacillus pseudomycoides]
MTKVTDVQKAIIPEVIAGQIQAKLGKFIKFMPLADVDYTLVAQPGTTVVYPTWNYIGDAKDVAEGGTVDRESITASNKSFMVKKAVKDIKMTDESILATNGAVVGESETQLTVSLGNKVDNDFVAALKTAAAATAGENTIAIPKKTVEISQKGLALLRVAFGEDIEDTVLIISPEDYGEVLSMKEFVAVTQGSHFLAGTVGHVMGLNIVVSGRLAKGEAYLLKAGALGLSLKRQVAVETERLMVERSQVVGADMHYVAYVKNGAKAIAVTLTVPAPPAGE